MRFVIKGNIQNDFFGEIIFIYKTLLAIALDDDKRRSPFVEMIRAIAF
ncbi:hypothetical protein [Pseudanabaena sp. UWO311]|nr:hypothetical protein [Pseudanabaena sp. UWO311]